MKNTEKSIAMQRPVIQANNIGVIFNPGKENELHGLRNVSLRIYPREYIIIFGPSGCGKSTLLYALSGLLTPSYGEVSIEGRNIFTLNPEEKAEFRMKHIGMVFQAFYLISTLSVADNVCLPRIFEGESSKKRYRDAMRILQRFKISEQADKYPGQLSGGQQQRVAIARSLINDPGIIFADEPVGNLDSVSSENAMRILKDLNTVDQKTVVLVTHDPKHLQYADRIFTMSDGQIVGETVQHEKRTEEAVAEEEKVFSISEDKSREIAELEKTPRELRVLMRTFQGISDVQGNILMMPFKAKQLIGYLTSRFSDRKREVGERYVREFLTGSIDEKELLEKLDLSYEEGGSGWNRRSAEKIAKRLAAMTMCARAFAGGDDAGVLYLRDHLVKTFSLRLDESGLNRLSGILRMRVQGSLEREQLYRWFDIGFEKGGLALRPALAERLAEEVELIMLLKYQ